MQTAGAELRGRVGGVLGERAPIGDAADEDMGPVAAQSHRREEGARHGERRLEVDRELLAQQCVTAFLEWREEKGAGVVHHDVGDAEVVHERRQRSRACRVVGEVDGDIVAVRQRRHRRPGHANDPVARSDECRRGGRPDAARGAGDQRKWSGRGFTHASGPSYST